jgi:hypothetical protein
MTVERRQREIRGPGAEIEDPGTRSETERLDRPLAPLLIEPGAEHPVEQVVPRSDRIEHPGDARGVLVWT